MREVTGSTWSFQIIIFFILIFACFLTLVLTYSKAYTIKNRTLTILEKYEGITDASAEVINNFMNEHGYREQGKCPVDDNWYGAVKISDGYEYKEAEESEKYYYCLRLNEVNDNKKYYDILVFFKFNLPIIGDITTFKIKGQTTAFTGANNILIGED